MADETEGKTGDAPADETRRVETIVPPQDTTQRDPGAAATRPITPARRAAMERDRAQPAPPQRWIEVAGRGGGDGGRTSPRMRFDVLQVAAWVTGLYLVIAGLVAIARVGFEDFDLYEVVTVAGTPATPLFALIMLLLGVILLAAGTGEVAERRLRILGVLLGVAGAVFLAEPDAFTEYLGVDVDSGTTLVAIGVLLVVASFVPPLSLKRPGVAPRR